MTFQRADILLPQFANDSEKMKKWSVVACDQYTSEPEYWDAVSALVGNNPSSLNLIVPELYLNDEDIEGRIQRTNSVMKQYIEEGLFCEYKNTYIFIIRTLASGVKRLGIIGVVDLEDYDYAKDSQTKIRATEGTVISRIPPRLKVRRDASLELPHIMLLIDDIAKEVIETNLTQLANFEKVYDFDLMQDSGHLVGYKMSEKACAQLDEKLAALDNIESFNEKYGINETSPLIYAMGDGNHSLATAKTHYENLKQQIGEEALKSPARYALCELVNLHDDSLVFEAIHRVVFDADGNAFLNAVQKEYEISLDEDAIGQTFTFVFDGQEKKITITNPNEYLTVASVQKLLDEFIEGHGGEVDYIHGEDVVRKLCEDKKNFGIILEAMDKSDLYKSVILDGALPRKTFSMGDACDKRFYTEVRKIQ